MFKIARLEMQGLKAETCSEAQITTEEEWLRVEEKISPLCPLLMPLIAKLTRVPIVHTLSNAENDIQVRYSLSLDPLHFCLIVHLHSIR